MQLARREERGAGASMSLGEKVRRLWTAVENGQGYKSEGGECPLSPRRAGWRRVGHEVVETQENHPGHGRESEEVSGRDNNHRPEKRPEDMARSMLWALCTARLAGRTMPSNASDQMAQMPVGEAT